MIETLLASAMATIIGVTALLTAVIALRQLAFSAAAAACLPAHTAGAGTAGVADTASKAGLPRVAVIVPAHNEEAVIGDSLAALARTDYPADRIEIIAVNDRSHDETGTIIEHAAARHGIIRPLHRSADARPGKAAALRDAIAGSDAEIFVFFDADYLPDPSLVRRLVAPFTDDRVGATMGRVVPVNSDANLLTRLIDLERRGGYVIDQQMRDRWKLLPQFGGTTGAVRASALREVGGWRDGLMTEDTYITYALFLAGYEIVYLNDAACYEESPQTWPARFRQVRRWAYGHNECLALFFLPSLRAPGQPLRRRLDAALILLFYLYPALACLSLPLAIIGPAVAEIGHAWLFVALFPIFTGFGNLAPFYQIAVAARKDGQSHVLRFVPLLVVSSAITMLAATHGLFQLILNTLRRRRAAWDKTARFRAPRPKPPRPGPSPCRHGRFSLAPGMSIIGVPKWTIS